MRGDVDAPRDPHFGMIGEPVERFCQAEGAARMRDNVVVQSKAEHPARLFAVNSSSQSFRGTDMKRREFIGALGGAATATTSAFGIRLRQLIGYDRLRSQPA
jgi:hypothetical protein